MNNKQEFFNKLLELRELAAKTSKESLIPREQRDFAQVAKVLDSTLYRIGYKKPRPTAVQQSRPSANIFIEKKAAKDKEVFEETVNVINNQKALDEAKKKQVNRVNSGKKKNATKKQTEQIKVLYEGGKTIAQISDDLNLLEDTIYSILGIDINETGALLADSTDND